MNATPTSQLSSARLWLLALALTACGIETTPKKLPSMGGDDAGAGKGGSTSGTGGGGRSGAGAGAAGKAGSAGGTAGGAAGTTTAAGSGGEAGDEAGAGGSAGSAGGEPECDESKSPKDEPCLVANEYAVFVKSGGVLGAAGTMDAPLPSVSAGIAAAVANDLGRVIVCGGVVYSEVVEITAGIRVYGGFDCSDEPWEHTGASTLVQPSAKGEALRIVDVEDAVLIEDLEFEAKDADVAGESSVAAMVKGSAAVTLKGVKLTAGQGMNGVNGTTVEFENFPKTGNGTATCDPNALDCLAGHSTNSNNGGEDQVHVCPAGDMSTGGLGGDKTSNGPAPGDDGAVDRRMDGSGKGGTTGGATCGSGVPGAAGGERLPAPGASVPGMLRGVTWEPAAGTAGEHGQVGQGGGGGGATTAGGGGGGGAGGCGGKGGAAGTGGGASIALLVVDSSVSLIASSVHTGEAGNGGSGAAGGNGMMHGGIGGTSLSGGCPGGAGGGGSQGGAGGGGAGGISVGVVWKGTEPVIDGDTQITPGTKGLGGIGGASNDGVVGIADATYEVES